MSARAGQWSDDEIEDLLEDAGEDDSSVIKNLRAALRAKTKQANEFRQELEGAKTASRKSTLADLLKARELDAKIATFIPQDIEATEEAVGKWLDEYGDVFGAKPAQAPEGRPNMSDDDVARLRQMDLVAGSASPAVTNDQLAQLRSADSPDAVIEMIRAAGGRV